MNKGTIYFDMDGTIADFYGQPQWLVDLENFSTKPYQKARPLINMSALAKRLNALQRKGFRVGIISWLSKTSTPMYDRMVTEVKLAWLQKHLGSVAFDEIHIVTYGTPKSQVAQNFGILFDDEERNRLEWEGNGQAYAPYEIFDVLEVLKKI
jgi:hypothetical protein